MCNTLEYLTLLSEPNKNLIQMYYMKGMIFKIIHYFRSQSSKRKSNIAKQNDLQQTPFKDEKFKGKHFILHYICFKILKLKTLYK